MMLSSLMERPGLQTVKKVMLRTYNAVTSANNISQNATRTKIL